MSLFRTANPAFSEELFDVRAASRADTMTASGTAFKTGLALVVLSAAFLFTWVTAMKEIGYAGAPKASDYPANRPTAIAIPSTVIGFAAVGCIGGLILGLVNFFSQRAATYTTLPYAGLEGLALGAISAGFELRYPGIVMNAVFGTFGTLAGLLLAHVTGIFRPSEYVKRGVVAATIGICLVHLVDFGMQIFLGKPSFMNAGGLLGIIISYVCVIVAALNLTLDFDFISEGERQGAPKYMEWYGAYGLLVTLVWLYVEILRLLAKLYARRD